MKKFLVASAVMLSMCSLSEARCRGCRPIRNAACFTVRVVTTPVVVPIRCINGICD